MFSKSLVEQRALLRDRLCAACQVVAVLEIAAHFGAVDRHDELGRQHACLMRGQVEFTPPGLEHHNDAIATVGIFLQVDIQRFSGF